jgi:8-oxo-dGTP pyrophosphatase MutT (NUDIX family)
MAMNAALDERGPYRGLVSVKGVVLHDGAVVLLRNERNEWELPGGRLERGESPEACVAREVEEELGLHVRVGPILDAWVYREIVPGADVLILTYGCHPEPFTSVTHSAEHSAAGWFRVRELDAIPLPDGYKRAIRAWAAQ